MCDDCGCRAVSKTILIAINILLLLVGLLMLGFGIALVVAPTQVIDFFVDDLHVDQLEKLSGDGIIVETIKAFGIFLLILGIIVALISFFGFFGACCDSKCLLITYAVILVLIVMAEIALIIFAAVDPDKFKSFLSDPAEKTLDHFKDYRANASGHLIAPGDEKSEAWHSVQFVFQCCGVNSSADYLKVEEWQQFNCTVDNCKPDYKVPISCCKPAKTDVKTTDDYQNYEECLRSPYSPFTHQEGCVEKLSDKVVGFVRQNAYIAIGICIAVIAVELILIALAIYLACVRDGSKYV